MTGMYKAFFSIDGMPGEENRVEGYTNGTNVCLTREQVSRWLDNSPYDYRFLEANTKTNEREYPVLLIYFDDREETIESTPLPTDDGNILEGYFMEGYCFIELDVM